MNEADPRANGTGVSGAPSPEAPRGAGSTTRRDFLKVLGVAGAGAAAASCGPPDVGDKLIPYLVPPEEIVPGTNARYATVLAGAGPETLGVHAVVRDGRVIKLEGHPDFPNRGRLSALAHSALQDLYDPDRVAGPRRRDGEAFAEASWDEALAAAGEALVPGRTLLLTAPVTGSAARFLAEWSDVAGAEWVPWEPLGLEALRTAHEIAFGTSEIPSYEIDRADRIVSFGADFLGSWLAPVELGARFAGARRVEEGRHAKFTHVGPRLSLTGLNADEWLPVRPGTEGLVALAVAREVARRRGGGMAARVEGALAPFTAEAVAERAGIGRERILQLAAELAAVSAPIALPPDVSGQGGAAAEAHLAVALLNVVTGAVGRTVRFGSGPVRGRAASFAELRAVAERMRTGAFDTVIVAGADPVYALPAATGFAEAFGSVRNRIAVSTHLDDTASAATWILPAHHELEAWGDAEVRPGWLGIAQPVLRPLFDTRHREDVLLGIARAAGRAPEGVEDWRTWLEARWREAAPADRPWEDARHAALEAGRFQTAAAPADPAPPLTAAGANYRFTLPPAMQGLALVTCPTAQFHDGRGANRSWMQELPDAVTKAVWSSWVEIHPETAEPLGVKTGDVVEVRTGAGSVAAPAFVYEGIRPDTVAVPLGQGHRAYGRHAAGRGVNALDLLDGAADTRSGALAFVAGAGVEITALGRREPLPVMQGSDTDLDREIAELLHVEAAAAAIGAHHVDLKEIVEAAWDSDPQSPYRWGMTIDLNACTGCGACVTACYAENNIPTVGRDLSLQGRDMSWMQIMRYFEKTEDGGFQTVHVPVLCQQCGDAPCEPVCPVYAAYHTPEGLNGQVYNRCVGTRYCANNCPYKVRRFNWFTYEHPYPLNLQLNPDVTVRQTGVMEKCTFCVQRINRAKLDAKRDGRPVADGEIRTACMQSCPTEAIVFGNLKDPQSRVSLVAKGARAYHMLGELNTRPAVTYLSGVTHARPVGGHGHGGGRDAGHDAPDDAGHDAPHDAGEGAGAGH
ncbi:MAG: 4Fe-4S dicluster domain-containing protein [Gemmatimonadota bacterium]|nr:4Fe-4S dicluster domain-containing protein [Gemmatimonadota bacterium]